MGTGAHAVVIGVRRVGGDAARERRLARVDRRRVGRALHTRVQRGHAPVYACPERLARLRGAPDGGQRFLRGADAF